MNSVNFEWRMQNSIVEIEMKFPQDFQFIREFGLSIFGLSRSYLCGSVVNDSIGFTECLQVSHCAHWHISTVQLSSTFISNVWFWLKTWRHRVKDATPEFPVWNQCPVVSSGQVSYFPPKGVARHSQNTKAHHKNWQQESQDSSQFHNSMGFNLLEKYPQFPVFCLQMKHFGASVDWNINMYVESSGNTER